MDFKDLHIVSVDDNKNNLFLVEAICNEIGLNVTSFSDSLEALMYVMRNSIDLLIIDYMMPNLNGLEFIKEFRINNDKTPIVMITATGDDDNIHKEAFEAGVNDFLSKPVNSVLFQARVTTLLTNYQNRLLIEDKAKLLEEEVKKATQDLRQREQETLYILGKTAEYKDPETASHVLRVAHYSKLIAQQYGLDEEEQEIIFYAAPFHDLGKVGIEDNILLKPGKLTEEEFQKMKTHAVIGYDILKESKSKFLQAGATIAITHHERYDGSGYPKGLKKEEIHLYGRIVAVVDVFDALTSTRPYKEAWSFEKALELLKEEKGKHFDPKIVDIFTENIHEIKEIYHSFQEEK
ncbi:two-component system response regulator [Halarcobacter mediterraneus]|uniref:Two-component system response regulator n=1 Tax=Halarcobacter mediterraneus TaxID=2023153 RepID=A0A4Q1AS97_9BACT|nr:HD domain-containing phosphohydrolase [Halarcobacter mediterraneus]RXK11452.1 two-component system response regulator [Halarcobacter mediterraneus]